MSSWKHLKAPISKKGRSNHLAEKVIDLFCHLENSHHHSWSCKRKVIEWNLSDRVSVSSGGCYSPNKMSQNQNQHESNLFVVSIRKRGGNYFDVRFESLYSNVYYRTTFITSDENNLRMSMILECNVSFQWHSLQYYYMKSQWSKIYILTNIFQCRS